MAGFFCPESSAVAAVVNPIIEIVLVLSISSFVQRNDGSDSVKVVWSSFRCDFNPVFPRSSARLNAVLANGALRMGLRRLQSQV